MRRVFHLLILLGVMTGLLGLEAAYATGPRLMTAPVAASQMDADCMEMMEKQQQRPQPDQAPCKGMTLDCIAAMGCVVPVLAAVADPELAAPFPSPVDAYWTLTTVLAGRDRPPEQHPPTFLG